MECFQLNLILYTSTFLLYRIEAAEFQLTDKPSDIQGAPADSFRSIPTPDAKYIALANIARLLAKDDYNEHLFDNDQNKNIVGKGIPAFLIDQIESIKQIFKPKPVIILKPIQKENDDQREQNQKPTNVQTSPTSQVIISNTNVASNPLLSQSAPISGDNGTLPPPLNNQAQLATLATSLPGSSSPTQPVNTPANSLWHILLYGFDNNKPAPTLSGIFSSALTSAINQYVADNHGNNGINNNEIFLQTIANLAGNKLANAVLNYIRNRIGIYHSDHHHHVHTELNGPFTSNSNGNSNQANRHTVNSVNDNDPNIHASGNAPNYQLNNPIKENVPIDFNSGSGSTPPSINAELIHYLLNLRSNEDRLETGLNKWNPKQDNRLSIEQQTDSGFEYNQRRNKQLNTIPINKLKHNTNSVLSDKAKLIDYLLRLQLNGKFGIGKGINLFQSDKPEPTVSEILKMNGRPTVPASATEIMNSQPNNPALETAPTNAHSTVPSLETVSTNMQSTDPASETSSTNPQPLFIASESKSKDSQLPNPDLENEDNLNPTNPEISAAFDTIIIKLLSMMSEDFTKYILYSILFNQPIEEVGLK